MVIIKQLREKHGFTQQELASASGLSRATIINFETGKRSPKVNDLEKIARTLKLPVKEFFNEYQAVEA